MTGRNGYGRRRRRVDVSKGKKIKRWAMVINARRHGVSTGMQEDNSNSENEDRHMQNFESKRGVKWRLNADAMNYEWGALTESPQTFYEVERAEGVAKFLKNLVLAAEWHSDLYGNLAWLNISKSKIIMIQIYIPHGQSSLRIQYWVRDEYVLINNVHIV